MVFVLSLLAMCWLVYAICVGDRGVRKLVTLRETLAERSHDAYRRIVRNRDLAAKIDAVRTDDRLLEELARARLGVVGRDEIVFVFPADDPAR
jgi:cell division protein FtsB